MAFTNQCPYIIAEIILIMFFCGIVCCFTDFRMERKNGTEVFNTKRSHHSGFRDLISYDETDFHDNRGLLAYSAFYGTIYVRALRAYRFHLASVSKTRREVLYLLETGLG